MFGLSALGSAVSVAALSATDEGWLDVEGLGDCRAKYCRLRSPVIRGRGVWERAREEAWRVGRGNVCVRVKCA